MREQLLKSDQSRPALIFYPSLRPLEKERRWLDDSKRRCFAPRCVAVVECWFPFVFFCSRRFHPSRVDFSGFRWRFSFHLCFGGALTLTGLLCGGLAIGSCLVFFLCMSTVYDLDLGYTYLRLSTRHWDSLFLGFSVVCFFHRRYNPLTRSLYE